MLIGEPPLMPSQTTQGFWTQADFQKPLSAMMERNMSLQVETACALLPLEMPVAIKLYKLGIAVASTTSSLTSLGCMNTKKRRTFWLSYP